jgi:hypothetical protein
VEQSRWWRGCSPASGCPGCAGPAGGGPHCLGPWGWGCQAGTVDPSAPAVLPCCRCHRVATGKVFTAAAVVGLSAAWVGRAIRLDCLRVVADLTRAHSLYTLPSWCIIHKRFNLSQADFSKRHGGVWAMCWLKSPLMEQPCRLCVCMCLLRSQCQPSLLLWRRLLLRRRRWRHFRFPSF